MTEKEEDSPQIQKDGATKWKVREKDNTERRESQREGREGERENIWRQREIEIDI